MSWNPKESCTLSPRVFIQSSLTAVILSLVLLGHFTIPLAFAEEPNTVSDDTLAALASTGSIEQQQAQATPTEKTPAVNEAPKPDSEADLDEPIPLKISKPDKEKPADEKKAAVTPPDKEAPSLPSAQTVRAVEKMDPKTADYYIREVLGTEVHSDVPDAEETVAPPQALPPLIPGLANGLAPLPHPKSALAFDDSAYFSRGRTFEMSRMLLWPMHNGLVTSRFGMRWGRMHHGTDIAAPAGTPILAAANGKVVYSGWEEGYGNLVILDHGNGTKTKYGHCSKLLVRVGEGVRQGDIIGLVGSTGHATGPHLHYEVVNEGIANNPEFFTRRR